MTIIHPVILASASPRRRELLARIGIEFKVHAVDINESCRDQENPADCARRLSLEKALVALAHYPDAIIIGSDTLVVVDNQAFFKPKDREDALRMLECLSGRKHEVMTGVAVVSKEQQESIVQRTVVTFTDISPEKALWYWETGEPCDKAGAYAIQGIGARFVKHLNGSYSGVMGLPLYETVQLLERFSVYGPGTEHA